MINTREFPIGVILSITTGRLCCHQFSDMHEALDYLTGETLFTHQLPRAADAVRPVLFDQHPFLRDLQFPGDDVDNHRDPVGFTMDWVNDVAERYGRTLIVTPAAPDVYEPKHPIVELDEMRNRR